MKISSERERERKRERETENPWENQPARGEN